MSKHAANRLLLVALILGIVYDLFFHGQPLGISWPLFVLLTVAALLGLGRHQGVQVAWRNLWLLAPLLFLAAMAAVRANGFLTFLNVAGSLALLGLLAYYLTGGQVERLGVAGYPLVWLRVGASALYRAAGPLREGLRRPPTGKRLAWPLVRGVLLALPVVMVFTCLLTSADLVFNDYVRHMLQASFWRDLVGRFLAIVLAGWVLAGFLAYALGRVPGVEGTLDRALADLARAFHGTQQPEPGEEGLDRLQRAVAHALGLGLVEGAIVLGAVSLLFGAFVAIQFAYLFGGEANITAQGYTYADYARRGFFELVAVAVLSLALILGLRWLVRRETSGQRHFFNALASLPTVLVVVMLVSAFQRMRLYELTYGFTELRLYVYACMVWLGALLCWLLVTLWHLPRHFGLGTLIASLGFIISLNLINPDAFIARQNLARYQREGKLDAEYLVSLSDDALPTLLAALDTVEGPEQAVLWEGLSQRRQHVLDHWPWPGWTRWPSLHLGRWQAIDALLRETRLL